MATLGSAWLHIGRQLRKPAGLSGLVTAQMVGLLNEDSNRIAIAALKIAANDTILELGFGPGRAIKAMANMASEGRIFGVDHSSTMYISASRRNRRAIREGRVQLMRGDFAALPWRQGSIDKCLAVHVAYFMAEAEIREIRRVLRPRGLLSMLVTERNTMDHWKFAGPSTHRLFATDDLYRLLDDAGFRPNEVDVHRVSLGMSVPGLLAIAAKSSSALP